MLTVPWALAPVAWLLACRADPAPRPPVDTARTTSTADSETLTPTGPTGIDTDTDVDSGTPTAPTWLDGRLRVDGDVPWGRLGYHLYASSSHLIAAQPGSFDGFPYDADGGHIRWFDPSLHEISATPAGDDFLDGAGAMGLDMGGSPRGTGLLVWHQAIDTADRHVRWWHPDHARSHPISAPWGSDTLAMSIGDIDGDAVDDAVFAQSNRIDKTFERRLYWRLGPLDNDATPVQLDLPHLTFEPPLTGLVGDLPTLDHDHDGQDEVVVALGPHLYLLDDLPGRSSPVHAEDLPLLLDTPNTRAVALTLPSGEPCVVAGDVLRNQRDGAVLLGCEGGQGQPTWQVDGEDTGDWIGAALAVGDLDNDGLDDLIAGAPSSYYGEHRRGKVYVWLGPLDQPPTPDRTLVIHGQRHGDRFGTAVAVLPSPRGNLLAVSAANSSYAVEQGGSIYLLAWDELAELLP